MKKDFTIIANEMNMNLDVEANIHYRYDNVDDLLSEDKETLTEIIYHHYTIQNQRLSVLDKYYKAQNVSVMNRERLEENKANVKMAHNFGKIFTQFDVGYSTGNPIKIEVTDENISEEIQTFNQENDIDSLNSELWLDVSKYGRAYELMYRSENDKNKIALSNVK